MAAEPGAAVTRRHLVRLAALTIAALVVMTTTLPSAGAAVPVRQPPVPGSPPAEMSPADVREEVVEVMKDSDFSYEKSLLERLLDWIFKSRGERDVEVGPMPASPGIFGGGIGALIAWLLIVAGLAAVVGAIIYVLRHRVSKPDEADDDEMTIVVEHRRRAKEWDTEARALESAGEWKDAIKARYRYLIRTLIDRHQLLDVPGRTTGELRSDLEFSTPGARESFDTASLLFELPWYADVATGPTENQKFREAAEEVLRAPAEQSYELSGPNAKHARPSARVVI